MAEKTFITGRLDGGGGSDKYALITEAGYRAELTIDGNKLTSTLFNKNGAQLSTYTVDLPLAQSIKSGYFDEERQELVFILTDDTEIRIPASKLFKGLATESYVNEKISEVEGKIPTVPTKVSAFENDVGYLTEHQSLEGYAKETYVDAKIQQLDDSLSTVAFSGSYNDLEDKPEIPSIEGLATEEYVDNAVNTLDTSLADVAKSGDYNDLSNKPEIPVVPTKVSAFENDVGYLTEHQSLKTINGESVVGTGNISVRTYQAMPDSWLECSTMEEFISTMWATTGVSAGMAYVGTVQFDPMPEGIYCGELIVEVITNDIALFKINSSDTPPYNWYYNTWTEDFTWKLDSSIRYGYYNNGLMYYDEEHTKEIPTEPFIIAIDINTNKTYFVNLVDGEWHLIGGSSYEAGENITIEDNVISATDTKYTAGTNITIDENNVISALGGDCTIGRTFTTDITVGHLQAGTQINATDKISDLLYKILFNEQPITYNVYIGKSSTIPSGIDGLTKVDFNISDIGVQKIYTAPQVSNEYIVIACDKSLQLQSWVIVETGWAVSFVSIQTATHNIFYINEPDPDIFDDGKITQQAKDYKFTFVEG